jgi:hypothetical protein
LNNLEAKREGVRVARNDPEKLLAVQAATKVLNAGRVLAMQAATSPADKFARGSCARRSTFVDERRAAVAVLELDPEERFSGVATPFAVPPEAWPPLGGMCVSERQTYCVLKSVNTVAARASTHREGSNLFT